MSLPIYQTTNKDLQMLQTNWALQLNPVIQLPINKGLILPNIQLQTGDNVISHLLGRKLQGWYLVRQRSSANIYDTQDLNQMPQLTLELHSSALVKVDLFVF